MVLYQTATANNDYADLALTFFAGIICIVIGNFKWRQYNRMITSGTKAEGTVTDLEETTSSSASVYDSRRPSVLYYAIISYKTVTGELITTKNDIARYPSPYEIGDKVKVIYDTEDPKTFIIDGNIPRLIGPILIIAGSVILSFILVQCFWHPITFL